MISLNYFAEEPNLDYKFWIPIVLSLGASMGAIIWGWINSKRLEKLKAQNEKRIHVHKERFDKEFEIYKDLWKLVCDFEERITYSYYTTKENIDHWSQTEGEYKNHSTFEKGNYLGPIQNSITAVLRKIEIEKPFYDKSVYDKLELLKKFIQQNYHNTDCKKWGSKDLKEFLAQESICIPESKKIVESISESISKRINAIENV